MKNTLGPVSVIIPALNEEDVISSQIDKIHRELSKNDIPYEIIVVDDGSTDNTAQRALSTGARLLRHPKNRGYGASLKTGIIAAENDIIAIIDADNTYPVDQIPEMLALLENSDM